MPNGQQAEAILKKAWEMAIHRNPMMMTKLRSDYDFDRLCEMIRDCLQKGLSVDEACEHVVAELFQGAQTETQPPKDCDP